MDECGLYICFPQCTAQCTGVGCTVNTVIEYERKIPPPKLQPEEGGDNWLLGTEPVFPGPAGISYIPGQDQVCKTFICR